MTETPGTEIDIRRPAGAPMGLAAKLQYARTLADSGLLPAAYRRSPSNILWAVEYGEMLGLSSMAAITGVHVIEGKPTASAGLISALVRRAGHKLRVRGDGKTATCQIIRSDDPEFTFEVTWTLRKNADGNPSAEEAGLLGKSVWKQYPASMLKSRAITQCARDACEEALFGLHYTPEELGADVDGDGDLVDAEVVDDSGPAQGAAGADPWYVRPSPEAEAWLNGAMQAAPDLTDLDACAALWRRSAEMVHAGELTETDAAKLQFVIRARVDELKPAGEEQPQAGPPALDPEDEWAAKVEGLASPEEAEAALAELVEALGNGMTAERFGLIEDAIKSRYPEAGRAEGEAA